MASVSSEGVPSVGDDGKSGCSASGDNVTSSCRGWYILLSPEGDGTSCCGDAASCCGGDMFCCGSLFPGGVIGMFGGDGSECSGVCGNGG